MGFFAIFEAPLLVLRLDILWAAIAGEPHRNHLMIDEVVDVRTFVFLHPQHPLNCLL